MNNNDTTCTLKKPYYCAINHPNDKNASSMIKEIFDYSSDIQSFTNHNNKGYPFAFENTYNHIKQVDATNYIPITISSDAAICASTVLAMNEKFINKQTNSSSYKVLFITDKHMMEQNDELQDDNTFGLEHFVLPTIMNLTKNLIINSHDKNYVKPSQIMMIGINDGSSDDVLYVDRLIHSHVKHLTLKRIQQMTMKKSLTHIKAFMDESSSLHVVFDLSSVDEHITPSVYRNVNDDTTHKKKGFTLSDISELLSELQKYNICAVDVLGFNASYDSENNRASRVTAEFAKRVFIELLDIKENKMNIFTEDSRFIVSRPAFPTDVETDIGWYILKNIDSKTKDDMLKNLELIDKIMTIEINNDDYLVTSTTIQEQNIKSYYTANSIYDVCLFPDEKKNMLFELINK
jgi:arginase family enzyme